MARYGSYKSSSRSYGSKCCSSRSCSSSRSRSGYVKSYNNSTRQTRAQRLSPTKCGKSWYDASGNKVKDTRAYFSTIEKNGKIWKE